MSGARLLRDVVAALDASEVPCMLTGSVALAYHGAPRSTVDIDLVIVASRDQVRRVAAACVATGLYASEEAAEDAVRTGGLFNVIDPGSGWKADLIHCKDRPFSREEFRRRQPAVLDGVRVAVATLEDVVLAKLEWARLGGSHRQLEDVVRLLRVREGEVDRAYVGRWVGVLQIEREWAEAERLAAGG